MTPKAAEAWANLYDKGRDSDIFRQAMSQARAEAIRETADIIKNMRCERCGYSFEDNDIHMDHSRCLNNKVWLMDVWKESYFKILELLKDNEPK